MTLAALMKSFIILNCYTPGIYISVGDMISPPYILDSSGRIIANAYETKLQRLERELSEEKKRIKSEVNYLVPSKGNKADA